jgi:hypothetical protein
MTRIVGIRAGGTFAPFVAGSQVSRNSSAPSAVRNVVWTDGAMP